MASSYPILDNKQLLTCLNEMDVRLTAEQLMRPTPDVVRKAFDQLVTMLLGVEEDDMRQPVFEAIDELEFPELYDETIPVLTFFQYLRKLMSASGYHDLSMRDLTKPEENRLRRQLSALVNFARFRETKLEVYLTWQQETDALLEQQTALAEANAKLAEKLQRIQDERAAQEPDVSRLRAETEEICAENSQLIEQQAKLQQAVAALQAEGKDSENEAERQKLQLEEAREDGDRLHGQIVESPEELRRSLVELQAAVSAEREAAAAAEQRCRELANREQAIVKVEQQLAEAMEQLQGLSGDMEKKREVSQRVKKLRKDIADREHEAAQLKTVHEGLSGKREHLQDNIVRHEQSSKLRKDAAAAQVEQQRKEKEAGQAANEATLAQLNEQHNLKRGIEEEIKALRAEHQSEKENVLAQYRALLQEVDVYHAKLGAVTEPKPSAVSHTPLQAVTAAVQ